MAILETVVGKALAAAAGAVTKVLTERAIKGAPRPSIDAGALREDWKDDLAKPDGRKLAAALEDFYGKRLLEDELAKVTAGTFDKIDWTVVEAQFSNSAKWAGAQLPREWRGKLRSQWRDFEYTAHPGLDARQQDHRTAYLAAVRKWHGKISFTGFAEVTGDPEVEAEQLFVMPDIRAAGEQEAKRMPGSHLTGDAQRLAVLLGKPGAGKTTLLEHLAVDAAGLDEGPLPVFLRIRHVPRDYKGGSLWPAFYEQIRTRLGLPVPDGFLEREADTGGILLLFDGLDEAGNDARRDNIVDGIARLVDALPEWTRAVISTRLHDYTRKQFDSRRFAHFELREFTGEQIQTFVRRWGRSTARTAATPRR